MKHIGRRLKTKREELGLSVEQVQAETKIRRRYIEALEAGEEGPIPGEVYLKGFLRFYGNFLGLDGPELVREYREWKEGGAGREEAAKVCGPTPTPDPSGPSRAARKAAGRTPARMAAGPPAFRDTGAADGAGKDAPDADGAGVPPPAAGRPVRGCGGPVGPVLKGGETRRRAGVGRLVAYTLLIITLVAAGGVWYVWNHYEPVGGPGNGAIPGDGDVSQPPGGGDGGVPGDGSHPPGGSDPGPEPGWAVAGESAELLSYVVYGAPFTVGLEVTTDRCWVRVVADGQVVLERTLSPGTTGEWTARGELSLVLGRPQLVDLTLNGHDLGRAGTVDAPRTIRFRAGTPAGGDSGTG